MKKIISTLLLAQSFFISADIFDSFGFSSEKSNFNVVIGADKAHEDLTHLKNGLDLLQNEDATSNEELLTHVEKCKKQIAAVEGGKFGENRYTSRLIVNLKSLLQTISTIRSVRKEWIALLKLHMSLLQDSLKEVGQLEQDVFQKKALYTFEDLQELERNYSKASAEELMNKTREAIIWIKSIF